MHHTAAIFLISTDVYAMNADDHAERHDQIYCYRSLHAPLDIQACHLVYVGRVIAAI